MRRRGVVLGFLYLLGLLGRSSRHTFSFRLNIATNIGNARIAGLEDSLFMSAGQFDLCLVASLQSVGTTFHQLLLEQHWVLSRQHLVCIPFNMTFFYRRSEPVYCVGLRISIAPLTTSFASSLHQLIVKLTSGGSTMRLANSAGGPQRGAY